MWHLHDQRTKLNRKKETGSSLSYRNGTHAAQVPHRSTGHHAEHDTELLSRSVKPRYRTLARELRRSHRRCGSHDESLEVLHTVLSKLLPRFVLSTRVIRGR
jgi:hypothetical protein